MSVTQKRRATQELISLYERYRPQLAGYPWESEIDRWGELVGSILVAVVDADAEQARTAVNLLASLDLLRPSQFHSGVPSQPDLVRSVLQRTGFSIGQCDLTIRLLKALSRVTSERWDNHIQEFLRAYGERMAADLTDVLSAQGIASVKAKKAAIVWLQNVCNMPLLLEQDDHVADFCRRFRISVAELIKLADELEINIALLDDVLSLAGAPVSRSRAGS